MNKLVKKINIIKNPVNQKLLAGSFVMVAGSMLFNFLQFVYHAITGRMLGTSLYGDFASYVSLVGYIGIIQLSLSITIVKFIAREKSKKKIKSFIQWIYRISIRAGILITLGLILFSPAINNFLKINEPEAFFLLALSIFFFIQINNFRSILQGLLSFHQYIAILLSDSVTKIFLSVIFIYAGYGLLGAVGGMLAGTIIGYFLGKKFLNNYFNADAARPPNIKEIFLFTLPVVAHGAALTSMYTSDLLLVKHFFSIQTASIYASVAVLGRVVFFGASPIAQVMFPVITKRHSHGQKYHLVFYLSVILVILYSISVTLFYLVIPKIPILILYGVEYLKGAEYLWMIGVFMGLLSLNNLFTQFFLSINKTKPAYLFLLFAAVQAILIWYNHSTINEVILMSIFTSLALFALLNFIYLLHIKNE